VRECANERSITRKIGPISNDGDDKARALMRPRAVYIPLDGNINSTALPQMLPTVLHIV
jgi:hypothetical protein